MGRHPIASVRLQNTTGNTEAICICLKYTKTKTNHNIYEFQTDCYATTFTHYFTHRMKDQRIGLCVSFLRIEK